jgi:putative transposase
MGRFNRFFRENILGACCCDATYQSQRISDNWREDYNFNYSHKSLGCISPKEFMPRFDVEFKFFIKPNLNNYLLDLVVS